MVEMAEALREVLRQVRSRRNPEMERKKSKNVKNAKVKIFKAV